MDLHGSLISTHLRIYPSEYFRTFLKSLPEEKDIPTNILKYLSRNWKGNLNEDNAESKLVNLTVKDLNSIQTISNYVKATIEKSEGNKVPVYLNKDDKGKESQNGDEKSGDTPEKQSKEKVKDTKKSNKKKSISIDASDNDSSDSGNSVDAKATDINEGKAPENDLGPHLTTSDIDWLYSYLQKRRSKGEEVPYIHNLLQGTQVDVPPNKIIKRNPELEARCVKLRSQAEARAYRKMTKGVDNVRMRFPEDSISYQMKQINRHLIAIGQFILSIFAGFMFGFKGIEWSIGYLDFGFRLLLGVICALIIALAEIYFLAKKLNEELNIPETVQLGGPAKFVDEPKYRHLPSKPLGKEHQD